MTSIAELESALRIEEEALERAYVAQKDIAIALYRGSVRRASEALTAAKVAESIRNRPASPHCQSGGRDGCTCSVCF